MSDPDGFFAEPVAATYDDTSAAISTPEAVAPVADLLAELAGGGAALELGIGTGRIAIPLAGRGVPVHGIELSRAMAARLQAKPGADGIGVTIGDFSTASVGRTFALAYLVFNTIENLTTQEAQVACFANVARHLEPGGRFVIEVEVPPLRSLPPGQLMRPSILTEGHWCVDEFDLVGQRGVSHHFTFRDGKVRHLPFPYRYVWPSELDLMARMAGMSLQHRWAGWRRDPFTSDSRQHVSVWRKA